MKCRKIIGNEYKYWRTDSHNCTNIMNSNCFLKRLFFFYCFSNVLKHMNWVSYSESYHIKFYVVSPLVSLSSMWLFLWLIDFSDASCCHSKPLTVAQTSFPSLKHCGTPRVHVSPPGGLEWHWDHNVHSTSWLCCSGRIKKRERERERERERLVKVLSTLHTLFAFLFIKSVSYKVVDNDNRTAVK